MLWLLLLSVVRADSFIVEMGDPVELRSSGAWVRVFPTQDGWIAALGSNSSFYTADVYKTGPGLNDWEMSPKRQVVDNSDLVDHAIKRCPDGSYLHAASGRNLEGGGSEYLYLWRYDEDFSILAHSELRAGQGTHAHNDPNLMCSDAGKGVFLSILGLEYATDFFSLDAELNALEVISVRDNPRGNGGGVLYDVHQDKVIQIGMDYNRPLTVNVYDSDLVWVESEEVALLSSPLRAYWAQGLIKVGEYYLLAHMGKDDAWMGSDKGDVFLSVLDKNWMLVEQQRVTSLEDGEAAMRPWVARKGDQVLLSFDLYNEQTIVEAKLDLSTFGLDGSEPDTGVVPGGDWVDPDEGVYAKRECGCESSEALLLMPMYLVYGWRRRSGI